MPLPRPRLLPACIVLMVAVLLLKSVGLVQAASTPDASTPNSAAPAAAVHPVATSPMPPPSVPGAPVPASAAPPVSEAERGLLLDLRHRRETLDARAVALDQRGAVLEAAERKIAMRLQELSDLQARLEHLDQSRREHDSANWAGLVHVYEAMKPRDAAIIFDALDMHVLLPVLDRMQERKAAPILAAMQPERARLATQMLAELRTRATDPGKTP